MELERMHLAAGGVMCFPYFWHLLWRVQLQGCVESDREKVVALQGSISQLEGRIAEARERQAALSEKLEAVRDLEEEMRVAESRREMLVRQKIQQHKDLEVENEGQDPGPSTLYSSTRSLKERGRDAKEGACEAGDRAAQGHPG